MGVSLSKIVHSKEISIRELQDKVVIIDGMNMLYQFVTTIRQQDGTPLKDSKGNITSHLTGLFSRCTKFMAKNLKLVFVFDGEMPLLKTKERLRREKLKTKAVQALKTATEAKNVEDMKKYAAQSAKVTKEMVEESKELLEALGIPVIQAPSEGEAQAAHMVRKGDGYVVASQDYDCLIYGAPRMVKNLSLSLKRKKINALRYSSLSPELLTLQDVLEELEISLDQLRTLAMLIGTDFSIGGVKGLGPKKSLQLVKETSDLKTIFSKAEWNKHQEASWEEVYDIIAHMPVTDEYTLEWKDINVKKVEELLVKKHEFSPTRIEHALEEIEQERKKGRQTGLDAFM